MFGWFVSLSAGGVTVWIPEDAVVFDRDTAEQARLVAVDGLVPVPLPLETAVERYDDGTIDVVLDPNDAEARLVVVDDPRTVETLPSGELLLPLEFPPFQETFWIQDDGNMLCIWFPWGMTCSLWEENTFDQWDHGHA